ncbi:TetR/AcrR family transcriptional regulator [Streptosporangium lutulentum]
MAAALELFGKRDAEGVSIDDVAVAAGASRALVYHYFGGKQELYLAALTSAAAQLEARLSLHGGGRPLEELADGLKRYFDFVEEHAAGFAALLKRGPDSGGEIVDAVRQRLFRLVMRQMRLEEPGPALRVTLRSWTASVESAALTGWNTATSGGWRLSACWWTRWWRCSKWPRNTTRRPGNCWRTWSARGRSPR